MPRSFGQGGPLPMATDLAPKTLTYGPLLARVGQYVLAGISYVGGVAILAGSAVRAVISPPKGAPPLGRAMLRQGEWLFGAGLPLVGLVHVGMGSFLAMQAYYGATFVEAAGPVVGVGLFRNVAPLLTGMTLAGLMAARITSDLSRRPLVELDGDVDWVADRAIALGEAPDPRPPPDPARLTAVRLLAAMVAGPILTLWGAVIGILVGWLITIKYLGVPTPIFFAKLLEMLCARDIVGVAFKGAGCGLAAALFPCLERL